MVDYRIGPTEFISNQMPGEKSRQKAERAGTNQRTGGQRLFF